MVAAKSRLQSATPVSGTNLCRTQATTRFATLAVLPLDLPTAIQSAD